MVVVTGGTGYVGRAVQEALLEDGFTVRVVARHGQPVSSEAEMVRVDLTVDPVDGIFNGAQAVVHLVGIIDEDPSRNVTFERIHVELTRRILEGIERLSIGRYIHMSALGTAAHARSRYHQTKWQAEQMVRGTHDVQWTILRPSLMFGGGATFFKMLARQAKWPVTPVPGDGRARFQPIYYCDVARFISKSLRSGQTFGQTYEMGGPQQFTLDELYTLAARPHRPVLQHIPLAWLMRLARLGQHLPRFPVSVDQLIMLGIPNVTDDVRWMSLADTATPLSSNLLP